jgi:cytoskeletal protein RodZ
MSRRPQKPKRVRSIRGRKFGKRRAGGPNWPAVIVVAAAVVVVGLIVTLLLTYRNRRVEATPAPTPATVEPPASAVPPGATPATATPEPPPPTSSPQPTVTATPVPQPCQALEPAWVRAQPADQSTGLVQLAPGDDVGVIGQVQNEAGETWLQVAGYAGPAYVRAEKVQCPAP